MWTGQAWFVYWVKWTGFVFDSSVMLFLTRPCCIYSTTSSAGSPQDLSHTPRMRTAICFHWPFVKSTTRKGVWIPRGRPLTLTLNWRKVGETEHRPVPVVLTVDGVEIMFLFIYYFGVEVVPNNDKIKLEFSVLCRNMKWMFWLSVFVFSPVCMSHYPHNPLLHNSSFFDLDFYRYCCHHFNTLNVSLLSIDTIILPHELSQTCQHQNNFWAQRNQSADRSNTRVARLLLFSCHGTVSQLFS